MIAQDIPPEMPQGPECFYSSTSSNESDWEDVDNQTQSRLQRGCRRSVTAPPTVNKPRRRTKSYAQTTFVAAPPRSPARTKKRTPKKRDPIITTDDVLDASKSTFYYAGDVLKRAMRYLRYPLSFLVFLVILGWIMGWVSSFVTTALKPFCFFDLPFCPRSQPPLQPVISRPDYPQLMRVQETAFDQLLDNTSGGSALALEIKKSEMATSDLATLVRASKLTSKDELANSLIRFVDEAKVTARGLQKLSSKVGGAVDTILAVNDHALRQIQAANANQVSSYSLRALLPGAQTEKKTNEIILSSFTTTMETSAHHLNRLVLEAQHSLTSLDKLEERLGAVHAVVVMEDADLANAKEELLALLWTKLGGNKRALRDAEEHLALLKDVGSYRKKALAHVTGALQTLTAMNEDMEDLRERVAAPGIVGEKIPVEVHMQSIRNGLERLRAGRTRAQEIEEEAAQKVLRN